MNIKKDAPHFWNGGRPSSARSLAPRWRGYVLWGLLRAMEERALEKAGLGGYDSFSGHHFS